MMAATPACEQKVVYVDKPVEKIVYVDKPVEKIVYVDRVVEKPVRPGARSGSVTLQTYLAHTFTVQQHYAPHHRCSQFPTLLKDLF